MRLKKLINLNKKKSLYLLDKYQKINFLIAIRYVNHQTKLKCKLKKSKINENIHLNKTKQKKNLPFRLCVQQQVRTLLHQDRRVYDQFLEKKLLIKMVKLVIKVKNSMFNFVETIRSGKTRRIQKRKLNIWLGNLKKPLN